MTATDLFAIVKDVPREAWPTELAWDGQGWMGNQYGEYIGDATAEAAFVGSMTAWLAALNWFPKSHIWRDGARVMLADGTTHRASSLVAALAAACKEVGGNGN